MSRLFAAADTIEYAAATTLFSGDFTLSMWVRCDDFTNDAGTIARIWNFSTTVGWLLVLGTDGVVTWTLSDGTNVNIQKTAALTEGEWHHIICTLTLAAGNVSAATIDLDGVEGSAGGTEDVGWAWALPVGQDFTFGRSGAGLAGYMSHAAIWTAAMTVANRAFHGINGTSPYSIDAANLGFYASFEVSSEDGALSSKNSENIDIDNDATSEVSAITFLPADDPDSAPLFDAQQPTKFKPVIQKVGHVTATTAKLLVGIGYDPGSDLTVHYDDGTGVQTVAVTPDAANDELCLFSLTGLAENANVDWWVQVGALHVANTLTAFKTGYAGIADEAFTFAVTSCWRFDDDTPISRWPSGRYSKWVAAAIVAADARFVCMNGDCWYADVSATLDAYTTNTQEAYYQKARQNFGDKIMKAMLRSTPTYCSTDNSDLRSAFVDTTYQDNDQWPLLIQAASAYQWLDGPTVRPTNQDLEVSLAPGEWWTHFEFGGIGVFMLDCRSANDYSADEDTTSKKKLSAKQLYALKKWLLNTELSTTTKFRVICSPDAVGAYEDMRADGWGGSYLNAMQELIDVLKGHQNIVVCSGNNHWGSMNQLAPGLYEMQAGPSAGDGFSDTTTGIKAGYPEQAILDQYVGGQALERNKWSQWDFDPTVSPPTLTGTMRDSEGNELLAGSFPVLSHSVVSRAASRRGREYPD